MVDGRTYERAAIEAWVQSAGTSPLTRRPVALSQLRNVNRDGGFDDDNDDVSISTECGWPRARSAGGLPAGPSQRNAWGAAGSGGDTSPFLVALLAGGGGLESEQAKALTAARPFKHRGAADSRPQEKEPSSARATGTVARGLTRVKGQLVVRSGRRHSGVGAGGGGGGARSSLLPTRWSSHGMGRLQPIGESGTSGNEEEW
jgi:hypothetical protein